MRDVTHVSVEGLEAQEPEAEPVISHRLMWWHWIKAYALFAPAVGLSLLRDWIGLSVNLLWALVLGVIGYLFAVRWLLGTQARSRPLALMWVVLGFLCGHALLIGGLSWVLWFLTSLVGPGF